MELKVKTSDPLNILKSTEFVVENSSFVSINPEKIGEVAEKAEQKLKGGIDFYGEDFKSGQGFENDLQLVFVENVVNFCFWAQKGNPKWEVVWPEGSSPQDGWRGLVCCFRRALAKNISILDAKFLAGLDDQKAREFFQSSNGIEIPLLSERIASLNEAGKVLLKKFGGKIVNVLEEANYDATNLARLVAENFSSFYDVSFYKNKEVFFLKRAQIFANDAGYVLKEKEKTYACLDLLTAFADYKIPQILRQFGIMVYNSQLAEKVDNYVLIPKGSKEEIEIRAACIWAIELIRQKLEKYMACEIDNALWLLSQDQSSVEKPYHRTYTIYY